MRIKQVLTAIGALLLLAVSMTPAFAQNENAGEIRGMVKDQSDAPVPDVSVTIMNIQTGVIRKFTTNSAGLYVAPSVLAGEYTITFVKEGFDRFIRTGISLSVQTITVDARMQVGSILQQVTVNAAAGLVQTETAERNVTVSVSTLNDVPIVGRNQYLLTEMLPGLNIGSATNGSMSMDQVGFNGTGSYQANFTTDGGSMVNPVSQNTAYDIPPDAVEEMNFLTSSFGAEYGNGVAVVSMITKSGTNRFKGTLFEFVQNNIFNARNAFQPTVPATRWNEFGGTVGGPIRKDKTFFFFSYQRLPQVSYAGSYLSFPTAAMRNGDFSGMATLYDANSLAQVNGKGVRTPLVGNIIPASEIDPVAKKAESYYALPNLPGTYRNNYTPLDNPTTTDWYLGKIDHNLTSMNRLTGTWAYEPLSRIYAGVQCPIASGSAQKDCANYPTKSYDGQVTDAWILSPSKVNELRMAYTRSESSSTPPSLDAGFGQKIGLQNMSADTFPNIAVGGPVALTGIGTGLVQILHQTSFIYSDVLTWTKGRHIIKLGGEYDRYRTNLAWDDTNPANLTFNGIYTRNPSDTTTQGQGYADFLFGLPQTWSASIIPLTGGRGSNAQTFIQDAYKIRADLTVTFGVRWMIQPGWSEQHGRDGNFSPTLINPATNTPGAMVFGGALQGTKYNGISPRFGFAWSPKQEWSVRGGYGMYNIMNGNNTFANQGSSAPNIGLGWNESGTATSSDNMTPIFRLQNGLPNVIIPSNSSRTAALLNGQILDYLPWTFPLTRIHQWQLGVQRELPGQVVLDVAYVGTYGQNLGFGRDLNQVPASQLGPGNAQLRRPYPQFSTITESNFDGHSNYNSLQIVARKRLSKGVSLQTSYTFSKMLDTGSGSGNGGTTAIGIWQIAASPELNYARSTLNSSNLFNGALTWALPVGRDRPLLNHGGVGDAIFGGWQLTVVWQAHSGLPFTPVVGTANLSGALTGTWLPNRVGNGSVPNPTLAKWFDTTAFVAPAQYTFGNSGRNILTGPGYVSPDLSFNKSFSFAAVREGMSLQFRMDASDILNHPNFGQPNANIGAQGAGTITTALNSRTLQLGARLTF
jgi:hypothetical protein